MAHQFHYKKEKIMSGERRTKSFKPLQISVGNASQMILPPMASELDNTTVDAWEATTAYTYGDIIRAGTNYYWCVSAGNSGESMPTHTDGDAADATVTWRKIRWHRDVVTLVNVAGAGTISIARGVEAVLNHGITLFTNGAHNEGYASDLAPYAGAWYAISDNSDGRALAISEG
jgi:hypothetical protein